ncbi:MAG: hypothetical protein JRN54_06255 [Nitrososphaerota archaeon]|nr:hypothetical protein [Nitrososphaerota archaeon]
MLDEPLTSPACTTFWFPLPLSPSDFLLGAATNCSVVSFERSPISSISPSLYLVLSILRVLHD